MSHSAGAYTERRQLDSVLQGHEGLRWLHKQEAQVLQAGSGVWTGHGDHQMDRQSRYSTSISLKFYKHFEFFTAKYFQKQIA